MMNLRTKYAILKGTTIALGAFSIPWSTFVGFCFGEGRYFIGLVALFVQTSVSLIDGYIWFWVLENMRIKMQKETDEPQGKETTGDVVASSIRNVSRKELPVEAKNSVFCSSCCARSNALCPLSTYNNGIVAYPFHVPLNSSIAKFKADHTDFTPTAPIEAPPGSRFLARDLR